MAPQKAPIPPISAATVATAEPRYLTSVAIAAGNPSGYGYGCCQQPAG
jgi:hypothetical protein